jgi:uncharacterized protein YecT (DUF1311 family)
MLKTAAIAVVALLATALPISLARADDLGEFQGYVETCVAEHGTVDKLVGACLDDQISSMENYLGDILGETEAVLDAAGIAGLRASQAAWESYRDASCAYHAARAPRDAMPRALMCRLRLVNARIAEILENEDFARFED